MSKHLVRRLLAAGALTATMASGATMAASGTAFAANNPDPGSGGGAGGSSVTTDQPRFAMYLVSVSQLNGGLLRDHDQITTSTSPGTVGFVQLHLHTDPNVRWWKEIKVFNRAGQAIGQDYTQDDKKDTVVLTFRTTDLSGAALVFSKAKAFGVHTGVYEVHNLGQLDGKRLDFTWQRDG